MAGSNRAKPFNSPISSEWERDFVPAYRLSEFSLKEYLKELFGDYGFCIDV